MHRDLKPENILLSRSGDVRIADLGAAFVHDASRLIRGQSYARDAVFTPGYAAPELVGSALRDDGAWIAPGSRCPRYGLEADWWALGCIMYMMMAGCMLFSEKADLLEYVERYKTHRGRAWLRSQCTMTESELRVLYGVRSFLFFLGGRGGMTRCDSYHFRCFSCSTSQSAGDLPLRISRGSHSSRMKSRFRRSLPFSTPLIFIFIIVLRRFTEAWTNLHISSTVLARRLRAFIVPKSRNTGWNLPTRLSLSIS
jgi:serine/threonine protein kinase